MTTVIKRISRFISRLLLDDKKEFDVVLDSHVVKTFLEENGV